METYWLVLNLIFFFLLVFKPNIIYVAPGVVLVTMKWHTLWYWYAIINKLQKNMNIVDISLHNIYFLFSYLFEFFMSIYIYTQFYKGQTLVYFRLKWLQICNSIFIFKRCIWINISFRKNQLRSIRITIF